MSVKALFDKNAEEALLGAILLNFRVMEELTLVPEDFYEPKHEKIYAIIKRKFANGEAIDAITLGAEVEYQKIGGAGHAYLHELAAGVPTAASAPFYANIIHESAVRRRLHLAAQVIAQECSEVDFSSLTESARGKIDSALGIKQGTVHFVEDEIGATMDAMMLPSKAFQTPWAVLTKAIGGFRSGSLYTIGARPAKGKTSIGLQIAMVLSREGAVAYNSLEMRRQELHKRIISIGASIPMDSTMNNRITEEEWQRIARLRAEIRPNIAIDDRAEITVHDIRAFARSVNRVMPLSGIVVDYLQLMSSKDNRPRHEIVAEMSRQLKILARDLDVPVIALSQLNRNAEQRSDKRPSLSDLRESGAIEQDSDVVILLHQEDDVMLLDVAKNRQGPPSLVRLKWQGEFARAVS
jgi:replicative DNA helicase